MASGSGEAAAVFKMVVLSALFAICLVTSATADGKYDIKNGRHNITMGHRRVYPQYPTDLLLFQDTPEEKGSWLPYPKVVSHDVCYPPKGSHPARFTITAFNVTDLVPRGEGGYAFVADGGVGSGKLCLHLKTQRGNGYKFNINIFGYYL